MLFYDKYFLRVCYSFNGFARKGFNNGIKYCYNDSNSYDTIEDCYKGLNKYIAMNHIDINCACVVKFDFQTKKSNIIKIIRGKTCFEKHPVVNVITEVDENKIYASEQHLIPGKVIFCEHKDKSNKLLHVCYKLFETKRLFAIYDTEKNTLYVIDTEHPDVEQAVLKIYEKYNCIIDFVSLNYLKNKIEGSTCRYKCRVK